ncbi:ATP-binding protein [Rhodoplanes elegans]|uniref:ATP-binding protein n=1 Tax=Rhodoplanes elegans TaxID=29408 RepID=A0A327K6F0_9BRAD|nr:terminase family protein [Rhodoplanes elegans]MBK5960681.1 ATP-binding protein [Rhodoplanes elegans]RAI32962.1 ATP-binding protein [Rhodoplanes elegans]
MLAGLPTTALRRLEADFALFAHPHQEHAETGNDGGPWTTWLVLGGRGAGKTRLGAEWVRALVAGTPPYAAHRYGALALIGESERDARDVMVEGASGLLRVSPRAERPLWVPTRRRLEWPNGAVAQVFSADDPDSLRGPQFDAAWCDELAKWRHAEAAFDMLQFGLRLGARPRQMITSTPRPIPLIRRLLADPYTRVTRAGTAANRDHLSPVFLETIVSRYAGTRLGRQELDGELIDDRPDALWSRALIETCRVRAAPPLSRIVVGLDPPGTSRRGADACGLVAAGRGAGGVVYVLEDASQAGLTPAGWAGRAVALYRRLDADAIVAEVNMGGEMVKTVLREVDATVPVKAVHATRGKWLRAEPVAALYEQGRVKHVGAFAALEDEMCDFGLDGLSSGRSPDRLDALVWAVTALTSGARAGPQVRRL